jgi:hypothetical protein
LGFIGFFCGQAGLAMMAGVEIEYLSDWGKLFQIKEVMLILPGVSVGVGMYMLLRTVKSGSL